MQAGIVFCISLALLWISNRAVGGSGCRSDDNDVTANNMRQEHHQMTSDCAEDRRDVTGTRWPPGGKADDTLYDPVGEGYCGRYDAWAALRDAMETASGGRNQGPQDLPPQYHNLQQFRNLSQKQHDLQQFHDLHPQNPDSHQFHDLPQSIAELLHFGTPLERFRCGDCVCSNVSREATLVDCNYKHNRKDHHEFPQWLPVSSQSIDLFHNKVPGLTCRNLTKYPTLLALNISSNAIKSLNQEEMSNIVRCPLQILDVSKNPMTTIADNSFQVYPELRHLSAACLKVHRITNSTFAGLNNLEFLDLSYGKFTHIEIGGFESLGNLRVLLLFYNTAFSYPRMSAVLFRPLKKLATLGIGGNGQEEVTPNQSLSVLRNLQKLYIDGNERTKFEEEIKLLSQLTTVQFGIFGFCSDVRQEMFQNLVHITRLVFYKCKFESPDPSLFKSCTHLEELELNRPSNLNISQAFEIIPFLNGATLKSLSVLYFHDSQKSKGNTISSTDSRFFQNLRSLEILKLEDSHIIYDDPVFAIHLPPSLKFLSLKGNLLHRVNLIRSICQSHRFQHLVEFDISDQNQVPFARVHAQTNNGHRNGSVQDVTSKNTHNIMSPLTMWLLAHQQVKAITHIQSQRLPLSLTPKSYHSDSRLCLQIFKANADYTIAGSIYKLQRDIKEIYISNANFKWWGNMPLPPTAAVADLSNNQCKDCKTHFLGATNHMEILNIRGNSLGDYIAKDQKGSTFRRAFNVTYLDLSHNYVYHIPYTLFRNMNKTKRLILAGNHLQTLDLYLAHMTSLKFLDVRRNAISSISRRSRDDLDKLAMDHEVTLALQENPLQCTCNDLEIMSWLAFTRVNILDRDFLTCFDQGQRRIYLGDSEARFRKLRRLCVPRTFAAAMSASCVFGALVVILSGLIFRNRWKLHYWRNVVLAKYYGIRQADGDDIHFMFDAFLVYSNDTENFAIKECYRQLTERGHKVCIEAKDFLPGSFIPCNIVSAVKNSTYTIPILSAAYRDNEWFQYSLQMALMESAQSGREVFHLILYEAIPDEELCADVLRLMQKKAFSELPPLNCPPHVREVFWDALSRTIGHTANPDPFPILELEP